MGTQPLSAIMEEKVKSQVVKTAVVSMRGQIKQNLDEIDEASVSTPLDDILCGKVPLLIGHPESWSNKVGQDLLRNLKEQFVLFCSFYSIKLYMHKADGGISD